ncbi:L-lactate permease [Demequina sp. NBRC 110056]|uniref:L-lactate permease n=1 Tax=Demequina sp. NBRC 110056 TaxID=1570345 RepID=UPI000A0700B5|nr:L-lactate permease [Demequina sp. NBRC 110056]
MLTLLASLPILAILLLMVVAKWSAVLAGTAAALGAIVLAITAFEFGGEDDPFSQLEGIIGVLARAGWVALTVMLIIGPALGIHHLQQRTGATSALEAGLSRITPDPRVAALLIVWFFCLLIEGAAGFGTPVALAAPFLVAAGFKPVTAVVAAMLGHASAVPFAAVGTPTLAQLAIVDYDPLELSWATAPLMAAVGLVLAFMVARMVGTLMPTAGAPWKWMAVAYVAFFTPYLLIARFVGPELPSLVGSIAGAGVFVAVVRWALNRRASARPGPGSATGDLSATAPDTTAPDTDTPADPGSPAGSSDVTAPALPSPGATAASPVAGYSATVGEPSAGGAAASAARSPATEATGALSPARASAAVTAPPSMSFLAATAPYLVLVVLVLVTRLITPVKELTQSWTISWELYGTFSESIQPLYHPGALLAIAFVAGAVWQHAAWRDVGIAFQKATLQVVPVFAALAAMVTVAFTMSEAGMTEQLAVAAAATGALWPVLSPFVGALGTFMTGSATASNILFTEFQDQTALSAELDPLPLLGAQGAGAAIGNIICPHNVVAAAATVGLSGREGQVLTRALPVAAVCLVILGAITWVIV